MTFPIMSVYVLSLEMPVQSIFDMLLAVFDRAALMLICLFFLTRTRHFRQLLQKMSTRAGTAGGDRHLFAVCVVQHRRR